MRRDQDDIVVNLNALVNNVQNYMGWWYFRYGEYQMVYIPYNDSSKTLRICIPHFANVEEYDSEQLTTAINETNREVRYVKVIILGNGSISINYDHKIVDNVDVSSIVQHMLNTLYLTANHLKNKILEKSLF